MSLHCFLLCFFIVSFTYSSSSFLNNTLKCSAKQSLALLQFKQNLSSINFSFDDLLKYYSPCKDWLGSGYNPMMMSWNTNVDCCSWDGVTCNHFTGDVIGLDLSCGMLQGTIHPNTTLFHLPHLQRLNLAYNDFNGSYLPHEIGRFASSLTHLNISNCLLTGQVPLEISLLPKLVSLDLSSNGVDFRTESLFLKNLLQNSTILNELNLACVDISFVLPTYLNISFSLKSIALRYTRLRGKLPDNIFNLPYLEKLDLSSNDDLIGSLPKVNMSIGIPLKWLSLSSTGLSGEIPYSVGYLKSLNYLSLSNTNLSGEIPYSIGHLNSLNSLSLGGTNLSGEIPNSIGQLKSLNDLDLSMNHILSGEIPYSIGNLKSLNSLDLSYTHLSGEIPFSVGYLKSLDYVDLSHTNLTGGIPYSIGSLRSLTYLDLAYTELSGEIPSSSGHLMSLHELYLSFTQLSGEIPYSIGHLLSLNVLDLSHTNLSGELPDSVGNLISLNELDLSSCSLMGSIPQTFHQLVNLTSLNLSVNSFSGVWELDKLFSSLTNLQELDLSYSGLSVVTNNANSSINHILNNLRLASCKLTVVPQSLRSLKNLEFLDLSSNDIHGHIPIWVGKMGGNHLKFLNLSCNLITGLQQFRLDGLEALFLQSNLIEGPFPPSICNMNNLNILDMSNNRFGGQIPRCFRNISSSLAMVDLGNNLFRGTIPNVIKECEELEGLILNGNELEGEVPSSLSKCRSLKVLDLGNNHLNGKFPVWLGGLPELQVLVLKSNKLHGPIECFTMIKLPFPSLKVLDLSHNAFVGRLPTTYFQNFKAMKNVVKKGTRPEYVEMVGLYYSITITVKDQQLPFKKILVDYTILDLSHNRFLGDIPDIIGSLNALIVLNLSHNSLTGRIPNALRNLSEIESLDLSWNQLTGEIPQSLADITNLAVLNLSQNHLVGRIPSGKQFNTFEGKSFGGNPELCGSPLPNDCEHPSSPQLEADEDTESGFTWKVVTLGYGCGTLVGMVIGYLMLSTQRPKWFNSIADAGEHIIKKRRKKKKRFIYIGK